MTLAQEPGPINTERPGVSSSPIALATGFWQLEAGYQYTDNDDLEDHTLPFLLLRNGLAENFELQIFWAGYSWIDTPGPSVDGANDASIAVKWQLTDGDARTAIALFGGVSIPTGSNGIGGDDWEPLLNLFWTHGSALFGTITFSGTDDDPVIGNAIGMNLPSSGNVGGFIEYYAQFQSESGPEHNLHGGLTILRNDDLSLDINAGVGLNDRAADFFFGFGVAKRFR